MSKNKLPGDIAGMVVKWFALSPQSKKVLGLNLSTRLLYSMGMKGCLTLCVGPVIG